jgi:serine/threonine protein kinase
MARRVEDILGQAREYLGTTEDAAVSQLQQELQSSVSPKLQIILDAGEWTTIDELAECYALEVENYTAVKRAGAGAFGSVYKVLGKDGPRALKVFTWPKLEGSPTVQRARTLFGDNIIQNEKIIDSFRHQGVVRYYESGELAEETPYMILEWIEGKNLEELGQLTTEQFEVYMPQILGAVAYMHEHGFLHNDLRPANIMVDQPRAKQRATILDYSLGCPHIDGVSQVDGALVSRSIRAPEADETTREAKKEMLGLVSLMRSVRRDADSDYLESIIQAAQEGQFSVQTDVWSLGNLMYELLTGEHAFPHQDRDELQQIVSNPASYVELEQRIRKNIPTKYQELIIKSLAYDPAERYKTVDQMSKVFQPKPEDSYVLAGFVGLVAVACIVGVGAFFYTPEETPIIEEQTTQQRYQGSWPPDRVEEGVGKYEFCNNLYDARDPLLTACMDFRDGEAALDDKDYATAALALESAIKQDSTNPEYYGALLHAYYEDGRYQDAYTVLLAIEERFPNDLPIEVTAYGPELRAEIHQNK